MPLFRIEYSPDAEDHLRTLTTRQQRMVLDAVEEQVDCTSQIGKPETASRCAQIL